MSFNNVGLNGLNLDSSVINRPIGAVVLAGSVSTDLIIPENVSDSDKILKTDSEIKIEEVLAENNAVTVRGSVFYTVLLLGDDGMIASVDTSENFELKEFIEFPNQSAILVYRGSDCESASRLVNPRKINVSSDLIVNIYAMYEQNALPIIMGAETLGDELCLNKKMGSVCYTDTYSLSDKQIPVSHDIHLDGNFPPMSEILYRNVKICPSEILPAGNNVTVKSKAIMSVIYKSEEGNIFALEKPLILERTFEADNANSFEWRGIVSANDVTAEIAIDGYGEAKLIELDFTYDVLLDGIRNVTVETVTDCYSTANDCQTSVIHGESSVYKRSYGTSLSVNASIERSEIEAENVRAVMLGSVKVKGITSSYSDEKKRLMIDATALVSAVCEDNITSENDRKFSSVSFEYPFKCELDVGDKISNTNYDISVSVSDVRFRCDQSKIYCDFENDVRVFASETVPYSYLSEIIIDKGSPITASYAPITLCYPSGGESLWDIAKYYKVTVEGIALSNNLESDDISDRKVLLIPSYRKSAPAYTKTN